MRFKRVFLDAAELSAPQREGDAGYDLPLYGDVELAPKSISVVGTGIAVEIPRGFVGLVKGRSGLAFKHGVFLKHEGVIDSGYRGEIRLLLENSNPYPVTLKHGERVAQLVVTPVHVDEVEEAEELSSSARNLFGFGSTGFGSSKERYHDDLDRNRLISALQCC